MPKSPMLTGDDRIEFFPTLGRKIRSGALANFQVADQDRLVEWIKAGRIDEAISFLEVMRPLYLDMNRILLEWSLSWGQRVREVLGADKEEEVTRHVHRVWSDIVHAETESPEHLVAARTVTSLLSPEVRRSRSDCQALSEKMNLEPLTTWNELIQLLKNQKANEALVHFDLFMRKVRSVHDFLCQYHWVYPTEIEKLYGQDFSEQMMMESFQSCSMYEGFFTLLVKLTPEGATALMAEHLRGHHSGPGRRGKVEIEENPESYRIIFDGCGSGGAMRRKVADKKISGFESYPEASPSTWSMKGVSSFCAHCAQNEILMVRRFGVPFWVVNYDPDPMKPCSWTFYKNLEEVPEKYYERIGFKKDPSRIAKLPKD